MSDRLVVRSKNFDGSCEWPRSKYVPGYWSFMDPEDAYPLSHSHIRSLLSPSGISLSERNWRLKFLWDQESLELLDLLVLPLGA
jgi:hypothetical protein